MINQYNTKKAPIMVKYNNCHHPDLPVSCNLLVAADIEGIKTPKKLIEYTGP